LTIAVLAPLIGVWVVDSRRRRLALAVLTGLVVALTSAMSLIRDEPGYLWPGLALLAATAACTDLASVPYNAMLRQVSTPRTSGRISGFGFAAGDAGSVMLLLVVYVFFISGSGHTRGLLGLPTQDGQNVRAAMVLSAAWLALFALPLLFTARQLPAPVAPPSRAVGLLGGYRQRSRDISTEWRRDRNLVFYLLASAIFRDGLTGVFAFGAVLGVNAYGISRAGVLIFGVAASTVAMCGAVLGGLLDDRIGSKSIIVGSLTAMVAVALILMTLSGAHAFWVCGLLLCLFIGPTQSSARTLLLRMAKEGLEGVAFGLYTMTGRAVSFLAPLLLSIFVDWFHTVRAGLGGLSVVLGVGLLAMLMVRAPRRRAAVRLPQAP
jgi:UMF1 family MFS transporter